MSVEKDAAIVNGIIKFDKLTKREFMATQILAGLWAGRELGSVPGGSTGVCQWAVAQADNLLLVLENNLPDES